MRITHREYISQIRGAPASAFIVNNGDVTNYRVNPYNAALFSWLPTLAGNFDQYRFVSLRLRYVPVCATLETGRVGLFFDKDSMDADPSDRVELANMAHVAETAPWAEVLLNVPTDGIKRFTNDSSAVDIKLVDLGRIGFATYSGNTNNAYGDLFIEYTVDLFEAQPAAGLAFSIVGNATSVTTTQGPTLASVASLSTTGPQFWIMSPGIYFYNFYADSGLGTIVPAYNGGLVKTSPTSDFSVSSTLRDSCSGTFIAPSTGGRLDFNSGVAVTNFQFVLIRAGGVRSLVT